MQNMDDITSDFACLKVSALGKASRISGEVDKITIGPDSVSCDENSETMENIENEQNSCNVKLLQTSPKLQNHRVSTQSGITFSVKKILLEEELQRRENVWNEIQRHWRNMRENGRVIQENMAKSRSCMARERERKSAEKLADILAEEERIAEQEETRRKHEQQLHAQRAQEQKEKMEREVEEYNKKIKEKEDLTKKVASARNEFGVKYCEIGIILKACKDKNSIGHVFAVHATRLKEFYQLMESIDQKLRTGELVPADLVATEFVVQQMDVIVSLCRTAVEKINALYDESLVRAQEAANESEPLVQSEPLAHQGAENLQPVTEVVVLEQPCVNSTIENADENKAEANAAVVVVENAESGTLGNESPEIVVVDDIAQPESTVEKGEEQLLEYVDKDSLLRYIKSQEFLQNYTDSYKEFTESASTKKFRFECQKAINIPVNAISSISEEHLRDKYEKLHNLLIGKSSPNVQQHPQGAAFCKDILAKKIVSQGETLVSSKPKMAFTIAAVIVALWNDHSDFGDLLLAHFHKTCPFTAPVFMPKREGQSSEEYYKSQGYKYSDDGTVEKQDKYLKRMSGLMRLYASISVTPQRRGVTNAHPFGLQNVWRWLAAILNTVPRADTSDLCATFILDVLEVAGSALWTAYPTQFKKLLTVLIEEYYPRMQSSGGIGGGPLVRLEEFLKNTLASGTIPPPDGLLPYNFW